MPRRAVVAVLFACSIRGQTLLDRTQSEDARRAFTEADAKKPVTCRFEPLPPTVDFSLRFRAGFTVHFPLSRSGKIVLRVAADAGDPAYFISTIAIPQLPAGAHPEGSFSGG